MSDDEAQLAEEKYQRGLAAAQAELNINEGMTHGYAMTLTDAADHWRLSEPERDRLHWMMAAVQRSYHRLQAWQLNHRRLLPRRS